MPIFDRMGSSALQIPMYSLPASCVMLIYCRLRSQPLRGVFMGIWGLKVKVPRIFNEGRDFRLKQYFSRGYLTMVTSVKTPMVEQNLLHE